VNGYVAAQGNAAALSACLTADRAEYERFKALVAGGEDIVAQRKVEAAKAIIEADEARL